MPRLPWIERTWAFDTPADVYPGVVERLRGTPARLEELVEGLTPAELVRHEDDSWSIQQNAGHLLDLEREAFLSLCGEEKTQARIAHMLEKNKPLRN